MKTQGKGGRGKGGGRLWPSCKNSCGRQ